MIALYEATVRFHALFGYLLCQETAPVYDEHLGCVSTSGGYGPGDFVFWY